MAAFRRVLSVGLACRRSCSTHTSIAELTAPECVHSLVKLDETYRSRGNAPKPLLANKEDDHEVIELIKKACKYRYELRPNQFANFMIVLSDRFMYDNIDVAKDLTEHGLSILHQFSAEDVVELCNAAVKPLNFTEFVRLSALHVLERYDELVEPENDLLRLWQCAVQKDIALLDVVEKIIATLVDKSVTLSSEQLAGFVTECGKLPSEAVPQALNKLATTVVSNISLQTDPGTLCDIVYMYGTSINSANKGFWRVLMPLVLAKASSFEPHSVVNATYGIASCHLMDQVEKGVYLKRIVDPVIGKVYKFSMDELTQLMEAFVRANCTHNVLFYDVKKVLKRQVRYRKSVLDVPKILFSLTRLKKHNKELLIQCVESLNGRLLKQLPTQNIPLLLYSLADTKLKETDIPETFLPALVEIVMSKWKSIPKDDFKLVAGCLDKLGYETRSFDHHKVMRMGDNAAKTIQLMNKWTHRDGREELKQYNLLVHEDRLIRHTVKYEKAKLNNRIMETKDSHIAHALINNTTFGTKHSTKDAEDSDSINIWHRDDADGVALALLRTPYFQRIVKQHKPPPGATNPLPRDNMEPAFMNRITYATTSTASD
eukprot:scpid43807/ scgid6343/ 